MVSFGVLFSFGVLSSGFSELSLLLFLGEVGGSCRRSSASVDFADGSDLGEISDL